METFGARNDMEFIAKRRENDPKYVTPRDLTRSRALSEPARIAVRSHHQIRPFLITPHHTWRYSEVGIRFVVAIFLPHELKRKRTAAVLEVGTAEWINLVQGRERPNSVAAIQCADLETKSAMAAGAYANSTELRTAKVCQSARWPASITLFCHVIGRFTKIGGTWKSVVRPSVSQRRDRLRSRSTPTDGYWLRHVHVHQTVFNQVPHLFQVHLQSFITWGILSNELWLKWVDDFLTWKCPRLNYLKIVIENNLPAQLIKFSFETSPSSSKFSLFFNRLWISSNLNSLEDCEDIWQHGLLCQHID